MDFARGKGMSDTEKNEQQASMEELLSTYGQESSEALRVGSRLRAKIISVGKESVFMDTGSKVDGVVDIAELVDEKGDLPYQVGDSLDLYVVSVRQGEIRLSRALAGIGGAERLKEAFQEKIPIEGRVLETCKGGLSVEVFKRRAFLPVSQIDTVYVENPEEYVGKTLRFLITELSEGGKNIVLSRRILREQEKEESRRAFLATMAPGQIMKGRVSRIMPYGAFVELSPGVEGMVHVSEMSWSRVGNPDEVLHMGEEIVVKIIGIEGGPSGEVGKISLSMKQAGEDPWSTVAARYSYGDKLKGRATRCMDYGVFVEIEPGVEGLVHISEMSYKKRVSRAQDMISPGDAVDVMIKEIDPANRRISLSMKDAEGDPWIGIKDRYRAGQRVEGTLEKKERFGCFITLEPGVTGLVPKSRIARFHDPAAVEKKQPGERIVVVIEEIDTDQRRITLAPADSGDEDDWKHFSGESKQPVSSLGEKLQQALKKKK